jgi:hypothetical protein
MVWCLASTLTILIFLTAVALAAAFKASALLLLEENMVHNITNERYYTNFSAGELSSTGEGFDLLQSRLSCCGVHGTQDYATFKNDYGVDLPDTCCPSLPEESTCKNGTDAHDVGCYEKLNGGARKLCEEVIILGSVAAVAVLVVTLLRLALGYYYQKHKKQKLQDQEENVQAVALRPKADNTTSL